VLGILPGIIGLIQSTEAVKLILRVGTPLIGRLLLYDALDMSFRDLKIKRAIDCPVCGDSPTIKELIDYDQFCGLPGKTLDMPEIKEIEPRELKAMMDGPDSFVLVDVREPDEYAKSKIPGSILIPLGEVPFRLGELDRSKLIVAQCRSGMRSAKACDILQNAGFENVVNLRGGILAWMKMEAGV
jgi:adenylyltransferase/sulfurtransferase